MSLLDHEFNSEYELMLSAWGEGTLSESALLDLQKPDAVFREFRKKYHRFPKSISLIISDPHDVGYDFCYTGVDTALLEKLETLKELVLPDTITHIDMSPKLTEIFKDNKTLIRGKLDSFAEKFAQENGLNFRPADFVFADFEDERFHESTTMTLLFKRSGNVEIKESSSSPGSSSSHTLGGSFTHALSRDFYQTQTAEQIAEKFYACARDAILTDGRLAAFIDKAKSHKIYTGKN